MKQTSIWHLPTDPVFRNNKQQKAQVSFKIKLKAVYPILKPKLLLRNIDKYLTGSVLLPGLKGKGKTIVLYHH